MEPVTLISLTDDIYGDLDGRGDCAIGATLDADGGTYSCAFAAAFQGDAGDSQTDIVTATVADDDGTERSNMDDATVDLTDVLPTVSVDKTVDPSKVEAGTEVTFKVQVTNTSIETVWLTALTDRHPWRPRRQGHLRRRRHHLDRPGWHVHLHLHGRHRGDGDRRGHRFRRGQRGELGVRR